MFMGCQMVRATYKELKKYVYPKEDHLFTYRRICWNPKVFLLHDGDNCGTHGNIYGFANVQAQRMCHERIFVSSVRILGICRTAERGTFCEMDSIGRFPSFFVEYISVEITGDQEPLVHLTIGSKPIEYVSL